MDKQKQIEEMALLLYNSQRQIDIFNPYSIAKLFCNAGYRKVPENAVVLTREEYARHKGFSREEVEEISETATKNTRKETAEKFEEMARSAFDGINCTTFDDWDWFYNKLGEIAKELEGENGD